MRTATFLGVSLALGNLAVTQGLILKFPILENLLGIKTGPVSSGTGNTNTNDATGDSRELLGDLLTLPDSQLTTVGRDIKTLLTGGGKPESDERYYIVPARGSAKCKQETCCVWKYISDEMFQLFRGPSGRCTKWARFAVRLGFHDAGTWSKATAHLGGGADGSIVLSNELSRPENNGLQEIGKKMRKMHEDYSNLGFQISMADLIQMGANVAAVTCPLGPRTRTFVGRKDSSTPAPDGLLPDVFAPADELVELFRQKTIEPHGLTALLGAHTTSQQHFVNTTRAGDPQDSTPGVWDVKFYGETIDSPKPPKRIFKFPSDVALAQHPKIRDEWKEFAGPGGQDHWNEVRNIC
jgi:hypothetical protein